MRKHTILYLAAAVSLTIGVFCASDLIAVRANKIISVPFYIATGVLAYTSYAIWKWGKQPTEKEMDDEKLRKQIRAMKDDDGRNSAWGLWDQLKQIEKIYAQTADSILASNNIQALQMLLSSYVDLSDNRHSINLGSEEADPTMDYLTLRQELKVGTFTDDVKKSKLASLDLLHKIILADKKRKEVNVQLETEMERIENQFRLALESAALKPVQISATIKVASDILIIPEYSQENPITFDKLKEAQ